MRLSLALFAAAAVCSFFPTVSRAEPASYHEVAAVPIDVPPPRTEPEPAPPQPPAAVDEEARRRLSDLEKQVKDLKERVGDVEEEQRHRTFGIGPDLLVPVRRGRTLLGAEANLRYFYGCYYLNAGGCLGVNATVEVWRFKLRWLGAGVFVNQGEPLTAPELPRNWDIMLTSGVDCRVWRGLELRAQADWFFPNPGGAYQAAAKRIRRGIRELDLKAPKDAWGIVVDAYTQAARSPYLSLGVRWEF